VEILDTLEQTAGLTRQRSASASGPQGADGAVLQMLQAQPGGVLGVVQQFERAAWAASLSPGCGPARTGRSAASRCNRR
jgi:hypothetical protein